MQKLLARRDRQADLEGRRGGGGVKFLQVYTFYPVYLDHWSGISPVPSGWGSDAILENLREDRFLASHDWARELSRRGWETRWWVANARPAVDAWLRERGRSPATCPADEDAAFAALIEEYQPDVLWIGNPVRFDGRFLSRLRHRPKLVVGWMAAPFPPQIDWRGFDLLLSHLTQCRVGGLRQGVRRTERFHPGFPVEIWERLGTAQPESDVVFSGQWTAAHAHRNAFFQELAKEAQRSSSPLDVRYHFAPHACRLPPEVERLDHGARWGLDMFRALRSGRIALNAEIDVASGEAGNMRLFEATGMGAMLLTEHQPNIESFFEPGREIETFRTPGEMLEKIRWYLGHPTEMAAVAEAGRKACHERFACADRARVLEEILLKNMELSSPSSRASTAQRVVVANGIRTAGTSHHSLVVLGPQASRQPLPACSFPSLTLHCGGDTSDSLEADFLCRSSQDSSTSNSSVVARGTNELCAALDLACHLDAKEVVLAGFDDPRLGFDGSDTAALCQFHTLRNRLEQQGVRLLDGSARKSPGPFTTLPCDLPSLSGHSLSSTVHEIVLEQLLARADKTVLHLHGPNGWRDWNGKDIHDRIRRWEGFFAERCRAGELVLFSKRLDIDLLAGYLGAMAAGCVPAQTSPESPKIPPSEHRRKLEHVLETTGAKTIFCDKDAPEGLSAIGRIVRPDDLPDHAATAHRPNPDGICLAQFSSGTTGLQKAVLMPHHAVVAHMDAYAPAISLGATDTIVSWLPLYHDMGLMAAFLMPFMEAIPLALMDPFTWIARPGLLGEAAGRFCGTIAFLPNFAYHVLARKKIPGLEGIRLFVNCSEPARVDSHRLFRETYPQTKPQALSVCYAMAENSFAVSQTPAGSAPSVREIDGRKLLSCGRILPGTEVAVRDPDSHGVGELMVRGRCLFARFLDGSRTLVDGFYPTGDLGAVIDGEIYVTGRRKDLLIVHGKNIHPQDVEHVAGNCPGVHPGRAVCFGVNSHTTGSEEMIVLFEPLDNADPEKLAMDVAKAIETEIGIAPRRTLCVPAMSLVKTTSGKMSRSRNKELYLQGIGEGAAC